MSTMILGMALLALQPKPAVEPELLPPTLPDWRLERINFPLPFAPELAYDGYEELQFAPGMFNPKSDTYFTYVFAMKISDDVTVDDAFLNKLLTTYYRGLCRAVAKGTDFKIDPTKITAVVKEEHYEAPHSRHFHGTLQSYDPFVTGKPLKLHLEILTVEFGAGDHRIYASVSPKPSDNLIWKILRGIEKAFRMQSTPKRP